MAGDFFQIDNDLPEKPETQRICDLTGTPVDTVIGRLMLFWRWVDRHADSAFIPGATTRTLARVAGGDENFWEQVGSLGDWLIIRPDGLNIPGWKKRFSESAKMRVKAAIRQRRHRAKKDVTDVTSMSRKSVTKALTTVEQNRTEQSVLSESTNKVSTSNTSIVENGRRRPVPVLAEADHLEISEEEVWKHAHIAASLFKRCGYRGDDGGLLWQIAVLCGRGLVPEVLAHEAANGAKLNAKRNPVGFVRTTLRESCCKRGIDLDYQLARLRMPPDAPKSAPKQGFSDEVKKLASGLGIPK